MEDTTKFRYVSDAATMLAAASVREPEVGEIVYLMDEEKLYIYTPHGYELYAPAAASESGLNMSLYDLNKAVVCQLKPIEFDTTIINRIDTWREETGNLFYMMYGKEISYFTVFTAQSQLYDCATLGVGVQDCLAGVAQEIYSIERVEDNSAIEIWIKTFDDETTCLYLFPYDTGIVKIGL